MSDDRRAMELALALAVARVMGHSAVIEGAICSVRRERQYNVRRPFTPHLGGADAWEVLEWVRMRTPHSLVIFSSCDRFPILCRIWCPDDEIEVGGSGPTDAIAMCRAVVALGEEG